MKRFIVSIALFLLTAMPVLAHAVWHCSRVNNEANANNAVADPNNSFSIALVGNSTDVIMISVRDLIDVYSSYDVRVSGMVLSACFIPSINSTNQIFKDLGLNPQVIAALARKSSIINSHLYQVYDEAQMLQCITKHYPAVGYFSSEKRTEGLAPCF